MPGLTGHAPSHAPGRYSRNNRHSGPPHPGANSGLAATCVPVIKTEKEQFEMSPLRDDCFNNIDLQGDSHKYLTDETAAIKIEPDMDCLDFCLNESLEGLMGSYPFENETDVKPDIKSHEKDFSPTAVVSSAASTPTSTATSRGLVRQQPQHQQPTAVPTGRAVTATNKALAGHCSECLVIIANVSVRTEEPETDLDARPGILQSQPLG